MNPKYTQARNVSENNVPTVQKFTSPANYSFNRAKDSVTPYARPFIYTGVDYFDCHRSLHSKEIACALSCITTRAIPLETTKNLSTDAVPICLRNFRNRRGIPVCIRFTNVQVKA